MKWEYRKLGFSEKEFYRELYGFEVSSETDFVCCVGSNDQTPEEEGMARLIAAAPELAQALKTLLPWAYVTAATNPHPQGVLNICEDIRLAIVALDKACIDPSFHREALDEMERAARRMLGDMT